MRRGVLAAGLLTLSMVGCLAAGCGGGSSSLLGGTTQAAATEPPPITTTAGGVTNVGFVRDLQGNWSGYLVQNNLNGNPLFSLSFSDTPENTPGRAEIKDSGCVGTATYTPAQDTPDAWAFSLTWQQGGCLPGTFTLSPLNRPDALAYSWTDGKGTASIAVLVRGGQPPPPATTVVTPGRTTAPLPTTAQASTAPATTVPPSTAGDVTGDCAHLLDLGDQLLYATQHLDEGGKGIDTAAEQQFVQALGGKAPEIKAYTDMLYALLGDIHAAAPNMSPDRLLTFEERKAITGIPDGTTRAIGGDPKNPYTVTALQDTIRNWELAHCRDAYEKQKP